MKVKPPSDLRLQCETCGAPVETLEARHFDNGQAVCSIEPCGHEFRMTIPF